MIDPIIDVDVIVEGLIPSQYENSPDFIALIKSFVLPFKLLEAALQEFNQGNTVGDAKGTMLDYIGTWFDVYREGRSDDQLRTAILAKIITEGSDGSNRSISNSLKVLLQTDKIEIKELYPFTTFAIIGENWVNGLVKEVIRLKPTYTNLVLLLAKDLEYQTFADADNEGVFLANEKGEVYTAVKDGIEYKVLTSKTTAGDFVGSDSIFGEEGVDVEGALPMADVAELDYKVVNSQVLMSDGSVAIDPQGNPYKFMELVPNE